MKKSILFFAVALLFSVTACQSPEQKEEVAEKSALQIKLDEYASFALTTDMSKLSAKEKEMIPILIEVADIMDVIFWQEAYGDKSSLMTNLNDEAAKGFADINYGPWDRLGNNAPFVDGVGEKPAGAQYYPEDMTKDEFEAFESDDKNKSIYVYKAR